MIFGKDRKLPKPSVWDPLLELLIERGALHEKNYLEHLEASDFPILRIDGIGVDPNAVGRFVTATAIGQDCMRNSYAPNICSQFAAPRWPRA
jgi:hypothetical protein